MNKTAIKNFAIWARNKLIAEITYKAGLLGITEKEIKSPLSQSTQTVHFFDIGTKEPYSITGVEIEQRRKVAEEIQNKTNQSDYKTAYKNVIEEVAYTWFNRLIAVRFMEVNDYLPTHVRVLSSDSSNKSEPDLVSNPMNADLEYTPYEKDRIMQLKNENQLDELFRMLFIKQCNALNTILPEIFEKTSDYTEVLLNVSFIDQDGVIYHLVNDIVEDDFNVSKEGQVEIIGWMYQYYNTEPKDETFALLKKNMKITKERIPSATQLFTPDWIVRYMVENSLGRLWLEGHPNETLKSEWKYYLDEAEQEDDVQKQLDEIREDYKKIKPEDIKVIDPCMGSGHILVYAFDVLMKIYENNGYSQRDATKSIIENNLYGLDIDNRAYQLAYFAVMMKARQYNRRILDGDITCHVYAIQESNSTDRSQLKYFGAGMSQMEKNTAKLQIQGLLDTFIDAKEYGSILNVDNYDWQLLNQFVENLNMNGQITVDTIGIEDTKDHLHLLVEIGEVIANKYDIVVTNPPYMGLRSMNDKLNIYCKDSYAHSCMDLFACFIDKGFYLCKHNGFNCMVTMQSWMFLSSFEKFRNEIIEKKTITSLLHMDNMVMGIAFGTAASIIRNSYVNCYKASYTFIRMKDLSKGTPLYFPSKTRYSNISADNFIKISGAPIAYWASERTFEIFAMQKKLSDIAEPRQGVKTLNNDYFMKKWYEVSYEEIGFGMDSFETALKSGRKWFPYTKGGGFRKWYGNNEYVVNWENDGFEMKQYALQQYNSVTRTITNLSYWFRRGLTWSMISSGSFSLRYVDQGFGFDARGSMMFMKEDLMSYVLGFLCSKIVNAYLDILSPTISFEVGNISKLPVIIDQKRKETIDILVMQNINISRTDWDFYEESWEFKWHPLVAFNSKDDIGGLCISYQKQNTNMLDIYTSSDKGLIENAFNKWNSYTEMQFNQLKANEEELNHIFIDIYGLQDELTPEVDDKDVTIRKADLERDIRSFISYVVGCIFGRYTLDFDGTAYAGGKWDDTKYSTFIPDKDNILPITDEEYFEDDVVGLFCEFLKKTSGTETLEENLDFIAEALGNKGNSSREIIRNYLLKDFFKDHCMIYKKRPIYWLFDSGKADGFKALVYIHRYNENTIGNLRIDYLHRIQRIYESEISRMQETIENSKDAREVTAATKRKEKLLKQLKETKEYDEKIAHLALARIAIDLDDGVKVNYEKVQTDKDGKNLEVLAKI